MNCINLDKKTVKEIVRKVVMATPYTPCSTPNAFAFVSTVQGLTSSNLGKTYKDYLAGDFWARDWVAAGANPDELKREFPLTLLEHSFAKVREKEVCRTYALSVVDVYDCEECGECNRTQMQVSCDTMALLRVLLNEVLLFEKYADVEKDIIAWLPPHQAEQLGLIPYDEQISDYLKNENFEFFEIMERESNMVGWSVQFEICSCEELPKIEFNYNIENTALEGVTACDVC